MRGTSLRLVTPPPANTEVRSLKRARKVLVVEADYFALTTRVDPRVIFWDTDSVETYTKIPRGVTHLWISKYASESRQTALKSQAKTRNITVWNCEICELRFRLLPFWSKPGNRSLMRPVDPDGSVGDDHQGPIAALKEAWERVKKGRIEPHPLPNIRKSVAKERSVSLTKSPAREPLGKTPSVPPFTWAEALSELPDLDRQVFSKVYGINPGEQPQEPGVVAEEFALPEENLKRILKRVEKKLEALGITIK